jgi:hypothetical protein
MFVAILSDQFLGGDRDPAARLLAQFGGTLPEPIAVRAQGQLEDGAVFGFGTAPVLGGAALQRLDDV